MLSYNNKNLQDIKNQRIYGLEFFDLIMLLIASISILFLLYSLNQFNKLKPSYESLRQDIKKSINNNLCNCSNPKNCNCKDEYIKFMKTKGIDLIF
ncbi:hypothetical protein LQK79_04480 [Clostridium guangxiense]|nr:hypothetical protein [Clostridium guangxiense]